MSIDTGRERIRGGRQQRRTVVRLTPAANPGQAGEGPAPSSSQESAHRSRPRERKGSSSPSENAAAGARGVSPLPVWVRRLPYYGLALLLVAVAALLRWALSGLLSPVPFLVFYLALVVATAFGGLGPGLLATLTSWLCIDFLFDPTPGHIGFGDPMSIARLLVFLASGLTISVVGEKMRRSRIRARRQTQELAAANAALRASEEKYRFLVENSKDITWMMDLQGTWTFLSGNVEKITGYRADEILGKTIWDFLAPECHDLVREKLRRRARGEDLPLYEVLIVSKDGRRIPFELHGTAIVDDGGNIVGVQGVSRDITERKRAEEQLRRSEQDLNRAQAVAQTGSWRLDVRRNELLWSQETHRIFGIPDGTPMTYETFLAVVHPADREYVDRQWTAALRGEPYDIEHRILVEGQLKWVREKAELEFDEEGTLLGGFGTVQDITERKRAEATLRASQRSLALAQAIAHLGNWSWDIKTNKQEWSDESFRIFGFEPGECQPDYDLYLGLLHPDDRGRLLACWRDVLERNTPFSIDYRIIRRDGSVRHIHSEGQVVRDDEGQPSRLFGINQDITEHKRAEEALRASQSMLQSVMENVPQGIFWKDRHSRYLGCNPVFARAVGLESPGDIIGKTDYDLPWLPEQTASFREYDRRIMANDAPEYHIIEQMQDADGRLLWVETNKVPLHDAQGNVMGVLGTYEDITERRRAEEALRASEEKYRFLIENSKDITYMIDLQGKWMFISSSIEKVTGYRADELIGRTVLDLLAPECHDLARENMRRRAQGEDLPPYEVVAVGKDGRRTPFEVYAGSIIDEGGNVVGTQGVARDITERKRAEQDLRESRDRYQALIETTADFIWEMDTSGKYTYCSPQMKDLWGYEPKDMIGKTPFDVMPPEDRKQAIESLMSLAKSPKPFTGLEASSYDSRGRLIAIEISGVPFFDADGRLLGYRGISRDVTERKQAEEAVAESHKKYRGLVEKINDWVWEIDADGVYTYVSPRARELLGYAPEEIVGKTPFDLMPPAEAQRVWNAFEPTWLGRKPLELCENTLVRKDGRLVTVETSGMPVFAEDGTFLGYTGIDRDVTERKQAEEALRKSEEKFAKAFRSSPIAIAVTRLSDGRILDVNEAMLKLLHFTADEVIGHTTRDLDIWVDLNDRAQFTQMLATAGSVPDLEYRLRTKDGAVVTIHLSAELLEFGGEPCMLSTLVDVTERERAAEALRQEKAFTDKLLNAPGDTVFLFEPATGQPIRWNNRFTEVSGYDDKEIAGMKAPDDFFDEQGIKKARESIAKISAEGQGILEASLVTKRGAHIPFEYAATVVETEDGRTLFLSIGRDITERKRAEEALRESEQRFRIMADGSPNPIWVTNAKGERIFANKQYLEYFGVSAEEMKGGEWKPFLHPDDAPTYVNSFLSSLQERRPFSAEARVRRADGQWRWIESHAEPRLSIEGEFLGFVGITQDVTERKRAEEVLRRSEEQFHRLFEDDLTADFITTPEGEILLCNPAFARTFGFSRPEDVVGTSIVDLYLDPRERRPLLERLEKEGKIERLEVWRKRRDGEPIYVVENIVGQFDGQGRLYEIKAYLFEDTQRKRAEDALRELTATLESKVARRTEELEYRAGQLQKLTLELTEAEERERKRLAEILHDDLQQVLAAAKFQVGLLSNRAKDDAESQEIAEQTKDLLGDAIAKSRSLSHELSAPGLSRSNLIEVFEWLAEQMQTKHGFTVHLAMDERIELASEPLRVLLYKAAQELLFNAIKHAGVHEATLRLRRRRGRVWLFVSDQGRGFDSRGLGKASGFGLLSIRERVEYLGGRMKIRSAPGKGSIFAVAVPDAEVHGRK
jgi:PAS domain S-box-containing protein